MSWYYTYLCDLFYIESTWRQSFRGLGLHERDYGQLCEICMFFITNFESVQVSTYLTSVISYKTIDEAHVNQVIKKDNDILIKPLVEKWRGEGKSIILLLDDGLQVQCNLSVWQMFVVFKCMLISLSSGCYVTRKNVFGNPVRPLFCWEPLLIQQILPLLLPIRGYKAW